MIQCFGETILKWIAILVIVFLAFIIAATILAYQQGAFASESYEFVYCHNEVTNMTITYPEGTKCGEPNIDENEVREDDSREATKQEEKAMKESKEK